MGKKRNAKAPDHWSEIVGMPDDWDKKNIRNLINKFKKITFYFTDKKGDKRELKGSEWIKYEVNDAREAHQQTGVGAIANPYGVKIKDSEVRIGTAIPKELHKQIEEAYPTMFRDKKHYNWFVKNFPEFRVASKW